MKNVYLYIIALWLTAFNAFSQEWQNANWTFGHFAGLRFYPNPDNPVPISSAGSTFEGCASVSDITGQLLFYSDTEKVYNKQHQIMPNGSGLLGAFSNTQGVIIVPRPKPDVQPNRLYVNYNYYVITIDGTSGQKKGLHYSEVDMTLQNYLGDVIPATKNTVLHDHNDIPIGPSYISPGNNGPNHGNLSEKLTSAAHCNGKDYWIVTQIGAYIYSYLVTSEGISNTPVAQTLAPIDMGTGFTGVGYMGQMKISPDGNRIGISYGGPINAVALGNFDSATGQIIFDTSLISAPNPVLNYGFEFSASGQNFYFSSGDAVYAGNSYTATSANLITIASPDSNIYNYSSFQLAINEKIYITRHYVPNVNTLSVINNPDDINNPDFEFLSVSLSNGKAQGGLPQWVHWQGGKCLSDITLSNPETQTEHTYAYADFITTQNNYNISSGQDINMEAGNYILLKPNSHVKSGSLYLAKIKECEVCGSSSVQRKSLLSESSENKTSISNEFTVYPNPATDITTISFTDKVTHINITSLDSRTLLDTNIKDESNSIDIDISSYPKGIYLVTAQTTSGKILTQKLMKN